MMNDNSNQFSGQTGFIWWIGVVEDRQDPLKLGRVRVRCVGWHSENKNLLPTADLPWAKPMLPTNHTHTFSVKEGDMVVGFFLDGKNAQEPVVMGSFSSIPLNEADPQKAFEDARADADLTNAPRTPSSKTYNTDGSGISITEKSSAERHPRILDEPTTSRIARNDTATITKTFIQERKDKIVKSVETVNSTWTEPTTKYDAKYPYNNVMETESGHITEFDDTPGKERIHIAHRNGSFQEMFPDGDKVEKITKDNYQIVMKDDHVYIMGNCNLTVQGNAEIYVKKNADVKIDGNCDTSIKGDWNIKVDGDVNETIGGNQTTKVTGDIDIDTDGKIYLN